MNGKLARVVQTKQDQLILKNMFIDGKVAWWEGEQEREINEERNHYVQ